MVSAHTRGSARSGRRTTTPARQQRHRLSSGHVRVLGLAATCTIWRDSGWISTRRSAHWRRRSCRIGHVQNGRGGLYREELLGHVKALCGTVGFSLSKGVLQVVAKVGDPDKIRDIAKLTAAFEKLQDMARGVERLRAAVAKAEIGRAH